MLTRGQFTQGFAGVVATASIAGCSTGKAAAPVSAASTPGHTSFASLKQVKAGPLDIGYAEDGPAMASRSSCCTAGRTTSSPTSTSPRSSPPRATASSSRTCAAMAPQRSCPPTPSAMDSRPPPADLVALMDALHIDKAVLGAYDWGGRTVTSVAALWPERVKAAAMVSGYLLNNLKAQQQPLAPAAERGWWYQYYFATDRGEAGYRQHVHDFNKLIWQTASPGWKFSDATYDRSAKSFTNPDHVAIVIHNYRWMLSLAPGEAQYDAIEQKLQAAPPITVPAITIGSDFDGAAIEGKAYRNKFTGRYEHPDLPGHRPQRATGGPAGLRQGRDGRRSPV
ncbi:LOW QUALITY PROTEIN: epoxide hydrolase, partial [Kutzneria sp. 744]